MAKVQFQTSGLDVHNFHAHLVWLRTGIVNWMMDGGRNKSAWVQGEALSRKSQECSGLRVFGTDRVLTSYIDYYHRWRMHRALDMDPPMPRSVHLPERSPVREVPEVGGLHHHYERRAA
jgi:hypothetical protein